MEKYQTPELCRNENLKEMTKLASVISMVNPSMPSAPVRRKTCKKR